MNAKKKGYIANQNINNKLFTIKFFLINNFSTNLKLNALNGRELIF